MVRYKYVCSGNGETIAFDTEPAAGLEVEDFRAMLPHMAWAIAGFRPDRTDWRGWSIAVQDETGQPLAHCDFPDDLHAYVARITARRGEVLETETRLMAERRGRRLDS